MANNVQKGSECDHLEIMKPPIIVDENGDVSFYGSVEMASCALEPIDVRNDEYVAYDSEGNVLHLEATDPTVTISNNKSGITDPNKLLSVLQDYFSRVGVDQKWIENASLSDLVSKGINEYESRC